MLPPAERQDGGRQTVSANAHVKQRALYLAQTRQRLSALVVLSLLVAPVTVGAQAFESVGNRAQGMGGAFVAVADDATMTWWNPAGVATGGQLSAVFERGQWTDPAVYPAAGPAMRNTDTGFALALPGFGLSYYRVYVSESRPSGATGPNADGPQSSLMKFALSQYGATTGRSIGPAITIASTLKLVRVGVASTVSQSGDALDSADGLDVPVETKGDIDFGAMASLGHVRLGFTLKHLFEPEFQSAGGPIVLERQARLGAAFRAGSPGAGTGFTVAFDSDLTITPTLFGDVRHIAVGAEGRLRRWLEARGGFSSNTVGEARPSWSGGLSLGAAGFFVDVALTFGRDESKKGWNIGVRLAI
jgi:hypothetical protein